MISKDENILSKEVVNTTEMVKKQWKVIAFGDSHRFEIGTGTKGIPRLPANDQALSLSGIQ